MFTFLWLLIRKAFHEAPPRRQPSRSRFTLEALEDRSLLSGGLSGGLAPLSGGSQVSGSPQVAVIQQSGGSGSSGGTGSGNLNLSGPGYPLPPTTGPTTLTVNGLSQPQQTVLAPMTGTSGGPGPSLAVVPVSTGGGPGPSSTTTVANISPAPGA